MNARRLVAAMTMVALGQLWLTDAADAAGRARGRGGRHCECFTLPSSSEKAKDSKPAKTAETPAAPKADAASVAPALPPDPFDKPGFVTALDQKGRLWVFRVDSPEIADFQQSGELAKHVVRVGEGPNGESLKAPDSETITEYLTSIPGFVTRAHDGRLWVFRAGSKELEEFQTTHELAKHVIRIGAGPSGATIKGPDAETLDEYLAQWMALQPAVAGNAEADAAK